MRLTEEQALQDDKRYASCNMLAELKYCGWDIPHRKSITNEEIRFYAWLCRSAVSLLKEQEELLRKLQNDKDKLCLEVSQWKHKFNDAPPNFVSQGVVDQICWERDTALFQLEQIGKGLGSKMDDIVAMLKEHEAVKPVLDEQTGRMWLCGNCGTYVGFEDHDDNDPNEYDKYCRECGKPVLWEGR